MPSRIAARLVTGPGAFLLGGVLDILAYAVASARGRWSRIGAAGSGMKRPGTG